VCVCVCVRVEVVHACKYALVSVCFCVYILTLVIGKHNHFACLTPKDSLCTTVLHL
jgi:hypothetical protein